MENTAETVTVVEGSLPEEAIAPECSEPRYAAIEKLVREAGQKMLKARPGEENIHKKEGLANFCTDYDTAIQRFLIKVWVRFFRELLSSGKKTRKETPVLMQRVNLLST